MIGLRIRMWLWTIDQRWLRWQYRRQHPGVGENLFGYDPADDQLLSIRGKIVASHYERHPDGVVRVIDRLDFHDVAMNSVAFNTLRKLNRQKVMSALGVPECMCGKMYDDNYASAKTIDGFVMTDHGLDRKPKGGDDID